MRVKLRTRAILAYLCVVCCGTILFGFYFIFSSSLPASKSHNGIERAAMDRLSIMANKFQPSLLKFEIKPDTSEDLPGHGNPEERKAHALEKQHMLHPPAGKIILPTKSQLQNMSWEALSDLYHRYTQQIQLSCANIKRLGKVTDGGWEICDDKPFRPEAPCLVYSFGVGDDFSFDDAVARQYNCEVHSFDPSMKSGDYQRESTVWFHAVGLADFIGKTTNGWQMSTLPELRRTLGHSKKPFSLLKLDIEEWEWKVLPPLLEAGHLSDTRQLLMELHQCDGCSQYNPDQLDKEPPRERYTAALGILKDLYDIGFRIFWHHQNKACRYISRFSFGERNACCEIHMVRTDQRTK